MFIILPNPIPELQHTPLPPKMLRAKEHAPTPCSSAIFTLDSHFESIKELGGVSGCLGSFLECLGFF
jgi:hypothetical protein